jgi:hypothetical protein
LPGELRYFLGVKNVSGTLRVPLSPADPSATSREAIDWHARWIVVFIAVGIAVRLLRYMLRFPLWGDETLLAVNFLHRDYAGLMRPLDCHQVAPLLFLWTELAATRLLGLHEWSLRLLPMLCGIASVFLFHRLARHLVRGTALVLAVGIFAATYSGIRYSAEVKPYSVDLMVSTLILLLTVRWWKQPAETRWLWALAAIMPLALGLSFPAIFVAGGASLAIAAVLLALRTQRGWMAWTVYTAVMAASFLAWYWLGIRSQAQAELGVMTSGWSDAFPPRDSLVKLAVWLVQAHASALLAVPVGGENWGSTATLSICLVAVVALVRQSRYWMLLLCAAPFALNLLAAALRRYPYGGHMRLAMHLVPIVCILSGIGAAAILRPLSLRERVRVRAGGMLAWPVVTVIVLLLTLAVAAIVRDFYLPGKNRHDIRNRDFAAWFWSGMEREHEVLCTDEELPPTLPPLAVAGRGHAMPQFLCNQRIYSPRHVQNKPCDMDRVSKERPLVCVQYWSHLSPYDPAVLVRWLDAMRERYELVSSARLPLLQDDDNDRRPEPADCVEVYEFVPRR